VIIFTCSLFADEFDPTLKQFEDRSWEIVYVEVIILTCSLFADEFDPTLKQFEDRSWEIVYVEVINFTCSLFVDEFDPTLKQFEHYRTLAHSIALRDCSRLSRHALPRQSCVQTQHSTCTNSSY
jgi:hypothetical protein